MERRIWIRHIAFWMICLAATQGICWSIYAYVRYATLPRRDVRSSLPEVHRNLARRMEEIERVRGQLQQIAAHHAAVVDIMPKQPYSRVLSGLAEVMNNETWLTQLAMERSESRHQQIRLKMTGQAQSSDRLGDFMDQLAVKYSSVQLNFATRDKGAEATALRADNGASVRFQLECILSE
jgi:Tfp pilus assembly protein PilN